MIKDGIADSELGLIVAGKLRRQAILYESGREIVHIVGEAALRVRIRQISVETMRGQLAHLAEMATLPGHTFAIVPFSVASPITPLSGFALYDENLASVETLGGELELTESHDVARFVGWVDALLTVAVTGEQAAGMCRQVAADS